MWPAGGAAARTDSLRVADNFTAAPRAFPGRPLRGASSVTTAKGTGADERGRGQGGGVAGGSEHVHRREIPGNPQTPLLGFLKRRKEQRQRMLSSYPRVPWSCQHLPSLADPGSRRRKVRAGRCPEEGGSGEWVDILIRGRDKRE